jgi:hypothetical protein
MAKGLDKNLSRQRSRKKSQIAWQAIEIQLTRKTFHGLD